MGNANQNTLGICNVSDISGQERVRLALIHLFISISGGLGIKLYFCFLDSFLDLKKNKHLII